MRRIVFFCLLLIFGCSYNRVKSNLLTVSCAQAELTENEITTLNTTENPQNLLKSIFKRQTTKTITTVSLSPGVNFAEDTTDRQTPSYAINCSYPDTSRAEIHVELHLEGETGENDYRLKKNFLKQEHPFYYYELLQEKNNKVLILKIY